MVLYGRIYRYIRSPFCPRLLDTILLAFCPPCSSIFLMLPHKTVFCFCLFIWFFAKSKIINTFNIRFRCLLNYSNVCIKSKPSILTKDTLFFTSRFYLLILFSSLSVYPISIRKPQIGTLMYIYE